MRWALPVTAGRGSPSCGGYAYVTWADGRNNSSLDSIISRVPLKLYKKRTASKATN